MLIELMTSLQRYLRQFRRSLRGSQEAFDTAVEQLTARIYDRAEVAATFLATQ